MRVYQKNQNEYDDDGKRYIEKIKSCKVDYKIGDTYILSCHIIQRGWRSYKYNPSQHALSDVCSSRIFYMSEDSEKTVKEEIDRFVRTLRMIKANTDPVFAEGTEAKLYITKSGTDRLSAVLEGLSSGNIFRMLVENVKTEELINSLHTPFFIKQIGNREALKYFEIRQTSVEQSPVYQAFKKLGDERLILEMRLIYNEATDEECRRLGRLMGTKILPKLEGKLTQDYVVIASTANIRLLLNSGYRFLHRPAMAMNGYTREYMILDPYTKTGIDAAKKGANAIKFSEYLKLFENKIYQ